MAVASNEALFNFQANWLWPVPVMGNQSEFRISDAGLIVLNSLHCRPFTWYQLYLDYLSASSPRTHDTS